MIGLFPVAKLVVGSFVGASVTRVVREVIKNNITTVTRMDQVMHRVGSIAIGGIIANQATRHVDQAIDEVQAWYNTRNDKSIEDIEISDEEVELDTDLEDIDVDPS